MPYEHTTFAQAKQRLAESLGDPGKVFFTDFELGRYIIEALQWWGLESMYFRSTGKLNVFAGDTFRDIFSVTDDQGNPLFDFGFTARSVINDVILALMEPTITNWPGGWIGSEMFNLNEIVATYRETFEEINKLTGYIGLTGNTITLNPTGMRTVIPDSARFIKVLDARIFQSGDPGSYPLWPVDQIQLQTTARSTIIPQTKRPRMFSVSYSPQLTIDLWPPPQTTSTLTLTVIGRDLFEPPVPTVSEGIPFYIPDAAFVIKYGMLNDLFRGDGLARAPEMAEYCEKRYKDGLDAISRYQSLLWVEINGVRKSITSVAQLNQLRPAWTHVNGPPKSVAQLNWSIFALFPPPDKTYIMTFETVRKAILPGLDGDFIQVGIESMRPIYDYAHHVALIKCQGAEFAASVPKYISALEAARDYRDQVASQSYLYRETQLPPIHQRWAQPYRRKGAVEASRRDRQFIEE